MSSTLDRVFISPQAKRTYVRRLFGTIAARYDLITRLLSFGQDQRWKERLIDRANLSAGARVLDLACGTGDLSFLAAERGANVTALDLTTEMIQLARAKKSAREIRWLTGDMNALPFPAGSFDVVTIGYGLRNVPELTVALAEAHRVLRPGGHLCSLDFERPESSILRGIYLLYLNTVGASLGWVLHGDPDTYRYIPASIRRWPGARRVAEIMRAHGFSAVECVPLFGGLMALHIASADGG
jgi:demethylmenaquinone methyltransferase/2-methoxy-6-polyprenyl-1,4-benzoquinol methylase